MLNGGDIEIVSLLCNIVVVVVVVVVELVWSISTKLPQSSSSSSVFLLSLNDCRSSSTIFITIMNINKFKI